MENKHINESILSEEILEDQKKNRIDHMTYLPDMQNIGSDIMDQVIDAMNSYDYQQFTAADVKRALAHTERTPQDFQALLSLLHCRFWKKSPRLPERRQRHILATVSICSHRSILPTTVKITAFTAVSTVTIRSTVPA